ncbi:hypothetical protein FQN54_000316 [Arachnomyces sp. PD_36]|nr:hypothetical protein FQN54_000316 [Arachnomyces sp. PD_36]
MRYLNRFYGLVGLAVCSILFSAWSLKTYRDRWSLTNSNKYGEITELSPSLVVFGDSWSDNSVVDETGRGQVWTEWLCSQFLCRHENLAESWPGSQGLRSGSVVDNNELGAFGASEWSTSPLPDLKSQIQQWVLQDERTIQDFTDREKAVRRNNTIHVVSFGVWDIWHLIGQDLDSAKSSAERSVNALFDQLQSLADKWDPLELKIILTLTADLSFLPGFKPTADNHKKTVALVEHWNTQVRNKAEDWERGTIFLFDTNSFMLDQIRERQLYVAGLNDEADPEQTESTDWQDVSNSCVKNNGTADESCSSPEQFLFWDDMHFGPSAHKLMGVEIFESVNWLWLSGKET